MSSKGVKGNHLVQNTEKEELRRSLNLKKVKKTLNLQKYFIQKSTENKICNQGKASSSTPTLTSAVVGKTFLVVLTITSADPISPHIAHY
jgi:hypothetical protein